MQWIRICLPMQDKWVQPLVQEDSTCCGTTKPMHQNYWAHSSEFTNRNYWAHMPQLPKSMCLGPVLCNKRVTAMRNPGTAMKNSLCSLQLEKACASSEDSVQPKINNIRKHKFDCVFLCLSPSIDPYHLQDRVQSLPLQGRECPLDLILNLHSDLAAFAPAIHEHAIPYKCCTLSLTFWFFVLLVV